MRVMIKIFKKELNVWWVCGVDGKRTWQTFISSRRVGVPVGVGDWLAVIPCGLVLSLVVVAAVNQTNERQCDKN